MFEVNFLGLLFFLASSRLSDIIYELCKGEKMSLFQKISIWVLVAVVSIVVLVFGLVKVWDSYDRRRLIRNYGNTYKQVLNSYKKTSKAVK